MSETIGDRATCAMCNKPITFVGPYWDHDGEIKPRHPATPTPWGNPTLRPIVADVKREKFKAIIQNEIQWCKDNPLLEKVTPEFRDGFIKGLEQALYLISQVELHGNA